MHPITPLLVILPSLAAAAETSQQQVAVHTSPSSGYAYYGCYNETTDLPDTAGVRALNGGTSLVRAGAMTADMCWEFCRTGAGDSSGGKGGSFKFAGLEYARLVFF
jgi:hypothetical protein